MREMDQYDDMPPEIFKAIMKFERGLDAMMRLRGKNRATRKEEMVFHYAHARNGDRIAREGQQKAFDKNLEEAKWKTDESKRAQYCCDKLVEEQMKNSKLRDENYALCLENEAQRTQLAAIDSKLKELEAKFRPSEPSEPEKAGVNQLNAPRRLN